MRKHIWPVVGSILLTAIFLSGCLGILSKTAEIKSGSYVRIHSLSAQPTPIAVGVVKVGIDRENRLATFGRTDGSEVTVTLAAQNASKWADGCPTNLGSTHMEILPLDAEELTLDSVIFKRPTFVANCPVLPTVIVLREAGSGFESPVDASGCEWWAGAKCIYFGKDYVTVHGQVVDSETGNPIQVATFVLAAPSGKEVLPGTFEVVLPGGALVEFEARAPGYNPSAARFEVYGNRLVVSRPDGPDAPILQMFDLGDPAKPVEFRYPLERAK
jgi:hypothetical protein